MKLVGVTAPGTGSGKTLLTLALLSRIPGSISFKIGPDFIDTQIHSSISGVRSPTIDRWLQGRNFRSVPCRFSDSYEVGIVEGVMGMYDSGTSMDVSTAYYFRKMKIPYILVINVSGSAESAYYSSRGFMRKGCLGVVINDHYSDKHLEIVRKEFEKHNVRVIGAIRHSDQLKLPERHLGLDTETDPATIRNAAKIAGEKLDLSFMDQLDMHKCEPLESPSHERNKSIWVAMDKAFNFYYEGSLRRLSKMGKLNYFSPLEGEVPEDPDLIYIGGGYPELYADVLSKQKKPKKAIQQVSEAGIPVLAECGGLMYLEKYIETDNSRLEMVGLFPGTVRKNRQLTMSYTRLRATGTSLLFRKGEIAYGHEFHYSSIDDSTPKMLSNIVGKGIGGKDGLMVRKTFGSYSHFDLDRYHNRLEASMS